VGEASVDAHVIRVVGAAGPRIVRQHRQYCVLVASQARDVVGDLGLDPFRAVAEEHYSPGRDTGLVAPLRVGGAMRR